MDSIGPFLFVGLLSWHYVCSISPDSEKTFVCLFIIYSSLEPTVSHMSDKCFVIELYLQPSFSLLNLMKRDLIKLSR